MLSHLHRRDATAVCGAELRPLLDAQRTMSVDIRVSENGGQEDGWPVSPADTVDGRRESGRREGVGGRSEPVELPHWALLPDPRRLPEPRFGRLRQAEGLCRRSR